MSSFVSNAACRGRRPVQLARYCGHSRPQVTAQLLRDRSVARFIVAPDGYGKTSAATEYAESIFAWAQVDWVNCQSPCFIRDLDSGDLEALAGAGGAKGAGLVVFDALPALDDGRADVFSAVIDLCLANAREVVVTCAPAVDTLGGRQLDRVTVSARDLLLTDDEVDLLRPVAERQKRPAYELSEAQRVPALCWGEEGSAARDFLRSSLGKDVPADFALALACMYLLQRGSVDDLSRLVPFDGAAFGDLLEGYPHLGYDEELGEFDAPVFSVDDLSQVLKGRIDDLVRLANSASRRELAESWAAALLGRGGSAERACDVVRCLCPPSARPGWLVAHAADLVGQGCFYGAYRLLEATRGRMARCLASERPVLGALESVVLCMLGDRVRGAKQAARFAYDDSAPRDVRLVCLLVLARQGPSAKRDRADRALADLVGDAPDLGGEAPLPEWLARAHVARCRGVDALADLWERQLREDPRDEPLCATAAWYYDELRALVGGDGGAGVGDTGDPADGTGLPRGIALRAVEERVRAAVEATDASLPGFFAASAGLAMEHAHAAGMPYLMGPLSTPALLVLRNAEMSVLAQQRRYERDAKADRVLRSNWAETHPDALLAGQAAPLAPAERRSVPTLELKLFGRFEASIGGEPVNPRFFRRQNVGTLLALLAVNAGREVPRDSLASALWPASADELARKNFYTVWSQLRKALTLTDGTCPYLLRHQYGCSLEMRYVRCDTVRFDEICSELMFGIPDFGEWPELYVELERDFPGELMPGDRTNPLLATARSEFRMRLIDSLLSASASIVEAGNPQWGIWFARAALNHERTREDAYIALMRAQVAADQRTAAMMTFLKCQRVLSEELGIDPSPEMRALYQALLDEM